MDREALPGSSQEGHAAEQWLLAKRRTACRPEQDREGARYQAEDLRGYGR